MEYEDNLYCANEEHDSFWQLELERERMVNEEYNYFWQLENERSGAY